MRGRPLAQGTRRIGFRHADVGKVSLDRTSRPQTLWQSSARKLICETPFATDDSHHLSHNGLAEWLKRAQARRKLSPRTLWRTPTQSRNLIPSVKVPKDTGNAANRMAPAVVMTRRPVPPEGVDAADGDLQAEGVTTQVETAEAKALAAPATADRGRNSRTAKKSRA